MELLANNVLKIIIRRKSVRKYIDKEIGKKIEILKEVVSLSPSYKNNKGYKFIFIGEEKIRNKFISYATAGFLNKINLWMRNCRTPYFVVAVGNPELSLKKDDKNYYLFDTSFAMEYLVLSACELGLGTCWIGAFNEDKVKNLLEIPDNLRVVAISPLGHPSTSEIFQNNFASIYNFTLKRIMTKRRKNLNEVLFYNSYRNKIEDDFASVVNFKSYEVPARGNNIIEVLKNRKYNLNFSNKDIKKEELYFMFEAARLAPSAVNSQIWRYILVDEDKKIQKIISWLYLKDKIKPKVIIIAGAVSWIVKSRGTEQPYTLIDVPISLSHITLMANALSISWDIILDFDEQKIRKLLNIPRGVKIIAALPLGYASSKEASPKNLQFYHQTTP